MAEIHNITEAQALKYDFNKCFTRKNPDAPMRDLDLVAAIMATRGNLYACAKLLGRRRAYLVDYVAKNPDVQAIRTEWFEGALDQLEDDVITNALKGDKEDRRFVLSTLAKDRGYSTRSQVTGKNDAPIAIDRIEWVIVEPKEMSDDDGT